MGLDTPAVKWLFAAKSRGVDFSQLATIGRQAFCPDPQSLQSLFDRFSIKLDASAFLRESNGYGELFYHLLGAQHITSFDVSSYEGAAHIHDMNTPVADSMKNRFSVVHDGGTLEHVFNFPQAIKNCMEMVRPGGHFAQVTVANNYMGHGFYQFSPEVMYRVFSPENGFSIESVLLHEVIPGGKWYVAEDPNKLKRRIEASLKNPTYIFTLARKTGAVDIFSNYPQQSDYVALWTKSQSEPPMPSPPSPTRTSSRLLRRLIPAFLRRKIRRILRREHGGAPPRPDAFPTLDEQRLLGGEM